MLTGILRGGAGVTLGLTLLGPLALPWAGVSHGVVAGHSMEPTYQVGDVVWSRAGDAQVGDVVRVGNGGDPYVHRVAAIDERDRLLTAGDANAHGDAVPVPRSDALLVVAHAAGLAADAWRLGTTWPARIAMAITMVLVWPTRTRKPAHTRARHVHGSDAAPRAKGAQGGAVRGAGGPADAVW